MRPEVFCSIATRKHTWQWIALVRLWAANDGALEDKVSSSFRINTRVLQYIPVPAYYHTQEITVSGGGKHARVSIYAHSHATGVSPGHTHACTRTHHVHTVLAREDKEPMGENANLVKVIGLILVLHKDLLPLYCPENQHCSCDHVSLYPTRKNQVSKA